jgi:hypothetical protein
MLPEILVLYLAVAFKVTCGRITQMHSSLTNLSFSKTSSIEDFTKLIQFGHVKPNSKACPKNYTLVDDTCIQHITINPTYLCDRHSILEKTKCFKYIDKIMICPPSYRLTDNQCLKEKLTGAEVSCPEGYQLTQGNICSKQTLGPSSPTCPSGSKRKGDKCIVVKTYSPRYICSRNYTLIGRQCIYESVYDCTQQTSTAMRTSISNIAKTSPVPLRINVINDNNTLLRNSVFQLPRKIFKNGEIQRYSISLEPPEVQEFIVQKTCKRTIREAAIPLCAKGDYMNGGTCQHEQHIKEIQGPPLMETKTLPVKYSCPNGYTMESIASMYPCVSIQKVTPTLICHRGYKEKENKCVMESPPKIICPLQYTLISTNVCEKINRKSPSTFYNVTYRCEDNNCEPVYSA